MTKYEHICYYDFEASTDTTPHQAYSVSFDLDGSMMSFYGIDCTYRFLERLPNNTLAIAHNCSYDISFLINSLTLIYSNPIIKNGRVLQLVAAYRVEVYCDHKWQKVMNRITFKDSYAIIPKALKEFPKMFQLDSGRKEVFPYKYYNSTNTKSIYGSVNEALNCIPVHEQEQVLKNLQELHCINGDEFDMIRYCKYNLRVIY